MNTQIETPKRYQCRHIFTDGRRCGSPCLRSEDLCYYHHTTRRPARNPHQGRSSTFELPLPEDRSAIQHSIGQVLQRIAANDIDPRRAGLLLYGLQIASLNLPKQPPTQKSAPETVEEITTHPELGTLAPQAEVGHTTKRKSTVAQLLEKILEDDATRKESAINETAQSTILPELQATEEAPAPQIDIDQTGIHIYRSHRRVFRGARAPRHAASQAPALIPKIPHHRKETSHMKRLLTLCFAAAIALTAVGCDTDTHDADVKAIQANEVQWVQDWQAKDASKIVAHYADDAVLIVPGSPSVSGKDAVGKSLAGMLADPALSLKFQNSKVDVAKSGDLAYTLGTYTLAMTDPQTKQIINDHGNYVTTYRKEADGTWKAVTDIASSDVPPPAPPPAPEPMPSHKSKSK